MQLSENIHKLRTEQGLSQGALADALAVSRQSVSKWENDSATPDLEKLIKMSKLFGVTLDELVYGKTEEKRQEESPFQKTSPRLIIGYFSLLFGMIFFLLSVFWGNQLRLGEEFGELLSIMIILASIALVATYNKWVLAFCSILYLLYSIVCVGILHVSSVYNYIFMFAVSIVITVWFLVLGFHETKDERKNNARTPESSQENKEP